MRLIRSTDKGVTWSNSYPGRPAADDRHHRPARQETPVRSGRHHPRRGGRSGKRRGSYAVWQDSRFSGGQFDSIAFSQSRDGGLTWSTPIKVNLTPGIEPAGDQQAFTASVHAAADGTHRFHATTTSATTRRSATLETDYFLVHCHPTTPTACTNAANWGDEAQLTDVLFDMRTRTAPQGFFTGDYEGLSNVGNAFTPFFSQTHGTDPSSTFFRLVE